MKFATAMVLLSGIFWTITYVALVYRGFKDKSYGMPLAALALNIAWEITYSIIYPPHSGGMTASVINTIWMICDTGIAATFLLYGFKYFEKKYQLSRAQFYALSLLGFLSSLAIMIVGGPFFKDFLPFFKGDLFESAKFIAIIQNAVMSILFVIMFLERRSCEGQSFTIAWSKWLGTSMTVGISYLTVDHPDNWHFMSIFVAICFIFDIWYMVLIFQQLRKEQLNPWTRL